MIRINLLGVPKPKKGKRAAVAMPAAEGGRTGIVAGVVVLVLILAVNLGYYLHLGRQQAALAQALASEQQQGQRLAEVKAKYEDRELQYENAQRRVCIINDLKTAQAGPVNLLTTVSDTVNATDGIWLKSMLDQGSSIELHGNGLSVHAIADFMRDLMKTGAFKSVEIKEAYQDETVKDMQVFIFTLTCEKQPEAAKAKTETTQQQEECRKLLQKS